MAISELQIALIGAGVAAVGVVWGYNAWQERQQRKAAARIFKGGQGDALRVPGVGDQGAGIGERQEPHIPAAASEIDEAPADAGSGGPVAEDSKARTADRAEAEPMPQPLLPTECADPVADCVLRLTMADAAPAPAVWAMQNAWTGELSKPVHWLANKPAAGDVDGNVGGTWAPVDARDTGRYREWAVALQLVDRRGPISDGELARFFDGVQQLARQTAAALELPSRGETILRAGKLDEFCAAVDIQFVLHVVEASGGIFPGAKLRDVAEAAGLVLEADGMFHARTAAGGELFTVANLGAERLDAESIKSLATHGLTLSLDVPRVADGPLVFDRILATARQLAAALGGVLVDAQRAPLAEVMIDAIRAKTGELQQRMRDGGIPPGGTRALRLFS